MPCYSGSDESIVDELTQENKKLSAMLCAILSVLEGIGDLEFVLKVINPKESGINPSELEKWWENHKKLDEQRKKEEQAVKRLELKQTQTKIKNLQEKIDFIT